MQTLLCALLICVAGTLRAQPGTIDPTFDPGTGASSSVYCIALQPDGKVVLAGSFTEYDGAACHYVARATTNGSRDLTFTRPSNTKPNIRCVDLQPDGKILTGGIYTLLGGYPRVERLNTDGTIDPSFYLGSNNGAVGGPSPSIEAIAVQPDGKILFAGYFTSYRASSSMYYGRLNADGTTDNAFQVLPGATNGITAIAVQSDGRIILSGAFTSFHGVPRNHIARLNSDGSLDPTFDPGTGLNHVAKSICVQPDGKIIITGRFTQVQGVSRNYLARLNADGNLDPTFDPGLGADYYIHAAALQPDGSIVVGGQFTQFDGVPRQYSARVMPNGTLDNSFDPGTGASAVIWSVRHQHNGGILIGGDFISYNGTGRNRIARINGTARAGIKLLLEGPYNGGTMNDALRTLPSFPLTEPYTGMGYSASSFTPSASIPAARLTVTGNNAIVDWVIVEMRPTATPNVVAASRAVLLQRDGDVVDLDGVSSVGFGGLAHGNYCVAVKPRNHLPVMLSPSMPLAYGTSTATVDFTLPTTLVHDNDARKNLSGVMVLVTGDANFDESVRYTGSGNDRDAILARIGGIIPTNSVSGYWPEDANMDGVVRYTGSNNDRDVVLQSIGGIVPTNTRVASLP